MQKLYILWTNADVVTSELMVFMYAGNAKRNGWWDEVTLIIWGATAKLCKDNEYMLLSVKNLMDSGVSVVACKACADELGATKKLEEIGVDVIYMGVELTNIIKDSSKNLITV
ncbi:MAG: DsrE family protein [Clostridiales bacterium]|nr:DsrE family protein [Clostridiales bacterium]